MMRFIPAFALGVLFLQMQAELLALPLLLGLGGAGALLLVLQRKLPVPFLWPLLAVLLLGFSWAGWRAQGRLADELPPAWEARDIELSGVIAALPQRFERGERFVFDVETVHTPQAVVPGRIQLSWYRSWEEVDDPGEA